jgi:hypothetical protein
MLFRIECRLGDATVKKPEFVKSHRYCFEMEMEISSVLTFRRASCARS